MGICSHNDARLGYKFDLLANILTYTTSLCTQIPIACKQMFFYQANFVQKNLKIFNIYLELYAMNVPNCIADQNLRMLNIWKKMQESLVVFIQETTLPLSSNEFLHDDKILHTIESFIRHTFWGN